MTTWSYFTLDDHTEAPSTVAGRQRITVPHGEISTITGAKWPGIVLVGDISTAGRRGRQRRAGVQTAPTPVRGGRNNAVPRRHGCHGRVRTERQRTARARQSGERVALERPVATEPAGIHAVRTTPARVERGLNAGDHTQVRHAPRMTGAR